MNIETTYPAIVPHFATAMEKKCNLMSANRNFKNGGGTSKIKHQYISNMYDMVHIAQKWLCSKYTKIISMFFEMMMCGKQKYIFLSDII